MFIKKIDRKLRAVFGSDVPAVVVFPVSHPVGISVIRSLGENGVPVLGVDFKKKSAGLYSRYCTPLLCPGIYESSETFFDFLIELGGHFKTPPVLFLVDDPDLIMSLRRQSELEPYYRFPLAGWEIVEPIMNKGKLYRLCDQHDFPIPKTWWAESVEALDRQRDDIRYPCIIKPAFSDEFRNIFGVKAKRFTSYPELRAFFAQTLHHKIEAIVQEEITGDADQLYTYGAYCNRNSEPISVFLGRKLFQFPPDFGTARVAESRQDEELNRLGAWLVKLTHFFGVCLTEFKRDPSGRLRLIELNPRPGGWVEHLGAYCGANFVLAAYQDTIGQTVLPSCNRQSGEKWVHFPEHMYYCLRGYRIFGYPESQLSFREWLRSLKGFRVETFFAWRDPAPALVRNWSLIKEMYRAERRLKREGVFRLP